MRHGSLFSGIGGFDLAAQWMGWENIFQVEIDPFCQKVLAKNFPEVKKYHDIKQFNGTEFKGAVDILTGGFPCQPFSQAGKRKGTEDDRHLWPEMLRVIGEVLPDFIVGENVFGLLNWSGGLVFNQVQADLEAHGYEVQPFVLPACAKNAPHRRDRVWIVAHAKSSNAVRIESTDSKQSNSEAKWTELRNQLNRNGINGPSPNPTNTRLQGWKEYRFSQFNKIYWQGFPTQSPICGGNDGIPNRVDRIKSLGNAIVPQVALEIFKAIEATTD